MCVGGANGEVMMAIFDETRGRIQSVLKYAEKKRVPIEGISIQYTSRVLLVYLEGASQREYHNFVSKLDDSYLGVGVDMRNRTYLLVECCDIIDGTNIGRSFFRNSCESVLKSNHISYISIN